MKAPAGVDKVGGVLVANSLDAILDFYVIDNPKAARRDVTLVDVLKWLYLGERRLARKKARQKARRGDASR